MFAALLVLLGWLVLWLVIDGIGRATWVAFDRPAAFDRPLGRFWLGFATLVGLLVAWHLAFAIDGLTWLPALALAGVGHARTSTHLAAFRAVEAARSRPWPTMLAFATTSAVAMYVAVIATGPPSHPDDTLYFLQTVALTERSAAVPGIGHLHHRLAFNHAHHLWVAFCGVGPFDGGGFHLANGLPLLSVTFAALHGLARTARVYLPLRPGGPTLVAPTPAAPTDLASAALFPICVFHVHGHVASAGADPVVFAFGAALFVLATATLGATPEPERTASSTAPFWWLAAAAVVVKPSLVLAAAPALASVVFGRRSLAPRAAVVSTLALLVPWMAHGVVLSGYPLFPSTAFAFDVDWKLPVAVVQGELDYVQAWGRESLGASVGEGGPVLRWLSKAWLLNVELLAPAVVIVASVVALAVRAGRPADVATKALAIAPPLHAAGIALWLVLSPDPRHAGALPWALAASLGVLALARHGPPADGARLLVVLTMVAMAGFEASGRRRPVLRPSLEPAPSPPTMSYTAGTATVLQAAGSGGCTAIDCTYLPVRTRMREPGRFDRGFRSEE